MRASFGNPVVVATEIGGRFRPTGKNPDRIVQSLVGPVCKVIWPGKTDVAIAVICDCDPRNARRYLSGELPMPAILLSAIIAELVRRK